MISDFHNKYMRSVLFWEQRTSQANSHFSQFCEHVYNGWHTFQKGWR